jgi:DNA end-binding protein Ku
MGARTSGSIKIVFGSFNFGAKLYICGKEETISMNMISAKTKNQLSQQYIDSKTKEKIENQDKSKGVPNGDSFIEITDADMESLQDKKDLDTLQIDEFVPLNEVSSVCVEKNYYLTPDKAQDQKYLLMAYLLKENKCLGIGKWIAEGKEKLVCIRHYDGGLVLSNLFYAKEFRPFDKNCDKILQIPQEEIEKVNAEFKPLIKKKFDHAKYRDTVPEKFEKMVQMKKSGKVSQQPQRPEQSQVSPSNTTESGLQHSVKDDIKEGFSKAVDAVAGIAGMFSRKTG